MQLLPVTVDEHVSAPGRKSARPPPSHLPARHAPCCSPQTQLPSRWTLLLNLDPNRSLGGFGPSSPPPPGKPSWPLAGCPKGRHSSAYTQHHRHHHLGRLTVATECPRHVSGPGDDSLHLPSRLAYAPPNLPRSYPIFSHVEPSSFCGPGAPFLLVAP